MFVRPRRALPCQARAPYCQNKSPIYSVVETHTWPLGGVGACAVRGCLFTSMVWSLSILHQGSSHKSEG